MPDITPFWISIQVAVISTIIVSVLGIFVCRLLYKGKGHLTKLLD
ncbi:molybdate ABC transporter permease subunit, partial [Staphylococcus aureus]|nr:molybdate ABC transporter permease subunit [Staphylococcus aureus]